MKEQSTNTKIDNSHYFLCVCIYISSPPPSSAQGAPFSNRDLHPEPMSEYFGADNLMVAPLQAVFRIPVSFLVNCTALASFMIVESLLVC